VSEQYRIYPPGQRPRTIDEVKRIVSAQATWCWDWATSIWVPGHDAHRSAPPLVTRSTTREDWTPENAVGSAAPIWWSTAWKSRGYQFVGAPADWNTHHVTKEFRQGTPWLLAFFRSDSLLPRDGEELLRFRDDFLHARAARCRRGNVSPEDYRRFLAENAADIARKVAPASGLRAERRRWEAAVQIGYAADLRRRMLECEIEEIHRARAVGVPRLGERLKISPPWVNASKP